MKIIMYPAISLDGFIAKRDGDSSSWVNQADEKRYQDEVKRCGAVIVGRVTYEQYKEDFDSYGKDVTVFVCTSKNSHIDSNNVKFLNGSAEEIIGDISNCGFDDLVVCGGGEVNGMLASANLVDEIVVSIQPVVLGEGIPLFGSYKPQLKLKLLSVNQDIEGVVQNHYKVLSNSLSI
ncbi:MAG: dihydrofolate reductase family protein [Candidatus Curtissbacteria bacterium]